MPHFDWTINLGNLVGSVTFLVLATVAWRDLTWRVKNLEVWRLEHQVDADSRDAIIKRMDKILYHVTAGKEGALHENWDGAERRKRLTRGT